MNDQIQPRVASESGGGIASESDWRNGPKDPDNLDREVDSYSLERGDTLSSVAKQAGLDWPKLARYNWGTSKYDDVYRILTTYVGAFKPTPDRKDFVFLGRSPSEGVRETLWLPGKPLGPQVIRGGNATRRATTTFDEKACPTYRVGGECTGIKGTGGEHPECKPIVRPETAPVIKLGKRRGAFDALAELMVRASFWRMQFANDLHRSEGERDPEWERSVLTLEFMPHEKSVLPADEATPSMDELKRGRGAGPRRPDMDAVAKEIRLLLNHDVLRGITVHGYTDSQGSLGSNEALSNRRASWVVNELTDRYGLDLSGVEIRTIGCGEVFAPDNPADRPDHRRNIVEMDTKPPKEKDPKEWPFAIEKGAPEVLPVDKEHLTAHESMRKKFERVMSQSNVQLTWEYIVIKGRAKRSDDPDVIDIWDKRTYYEYPYRRDALVFMAMGYEVDRSGNVTDEVSIVVPGFEKEDKFRRDLYETIPVLDHLFWELIPEWRSTSHADEAFETMNKWLRTWPSRVSRMPVYHPTMKEYPVRLRGRTVSQEGHFFFEWNLSSDKLDKLAKELAAERITHQIPWMPVRGFPVGEPR